jgi:hypothetical protein
MNATAKASRLPPGWLVGTWEFTHTTAPVCSPFPIVYHFDHFGINYWETPFAKLPKKRVISKIPYREDVNGYWLLWPATSRFHRCEESFGEILSVGIDENLWWMRRLSLPTPDLQYFVDLESGELIDLAERLPLNVRAQQAAP